VSFQLTSAGVTVAAHVLIMLAIAVRVIMQRPAPGVALAWLLLTASLPFGGAVIYFLIGERRIGARRELGVRRLRAAFESIDELESRQGFADIDWSRHPPAARGMDSLGRRAVGSATLRGSGLQLFADTQETFRAIGRDVEAAKKSLLMEFYIWQEGGAADDLLEAVIRAARRGVSCRLLVDALGARPWWRGEQPRRLSEAGVELRPALPAGLLRTFVGRTDLRLHRKIVVIDGDIAWTGSMNMVDPRFFKQDAGVGQWVDAMVRVQGSAVAPLAVTMISDWTIESGETNRELVEQLGIHLVAPAGEADIQVFPAGPGETGDGLLQMLLTLINAAERELLLTTPYLVPDESVLRALRGAAARGVEVSVIVPQRVDSVATRHASRSYYDDLLNAGVEIWLYGGGLLHTKSITVDGVLSMFGSVNVDMRSLWLNYEVALFVYDAAFAADLRSLQQRYIAGADRLDPAAWRRRPFARRFIENTLRLVSPLL
jgi:cardiolipin synthase